MYLRNLMNRWTGWKRASRTYAPRKPLKSPPSWTQLKIEALDERVLPSITANLRGSVLSVVADTTNGTAQVEIIRANKQVMIDDGGHLVNRFTTDQIQQIQFQYNQFALHLPVNQGQVLFSGLPMGEADLNLGHSSLAAAVQTALPDGTALKLSGAVDNQGNYDLKGTANVTVAGFALPGATFESTNTRLTAAAAVALGGNTVNLAGTVDSHGNYSLTGTHHLTVAGVGLDPTWTLTNTNLAIATTLNLPIVGRPVNLSGTVNAHGQFSLTAGVPNISVLFVTLTNASVTLTNTSVTVKGHASNLPLVGSVDFTGTSSGSSYTFTATQPSVNVLGFTLTNLKVALSSNGLSIGAHAANVPLVGAVDFSGPISASGFSLSATAPNVNLLGFIHFASISLTLTPQRLSLSATTTLPIVNQVTFTGAINFNGSFTISATAPHFTLLGFLGMDNATVSLTFPNPTLTVLAHLDLLNIGKVDFTGSIGAGGTFSIDGSAALTVAGFSLGKANLHMGNKPGDASDGIKIGPFTTPPLPVVGPVTIQGSYASGGKFSFDVDINPTPPILLGPIPFNRFHFGLTNDSLTLGAGVGFTLTSALNLSGYAQVTVHTNGDFKLTATVDATVLGFSAANAQLVLERANRVFTMTLDANLNLFIMTASFHGLIDFTHGQFSFTAQHDLTVANFPLSKTNFVATNIPDPVHYPGINLRIELHSHTNLHIPAIASGADIDFDGVLLKRSGSTYSISVHGKASLVVASFNIASASLDIDNTHLAVSFYYAYPGIFALNFAGSVDYHGNFDIWAHGTVGLAGFGATADLHLTNSSLTISAAIDVKVATVSFMGSFQANGQFSLTGSASVHLAGFASASASFALNNGGVTFSTTIDVTVATVGFSGYVHSDGTFLLSGSAGVNLLGFVGASMVFTISNSGVAFEGNINALVATVYFRGWVQADGQFDLSGGAGANFAGFIGANVSFEVFNKDIVVWGVRRRSTGLTFSGNIDVKVAASVSFSGYINADGTFDVIGNAHVGFVGFGAQATFELYNKDIIFWGMRTRVSGVSVGATLDIRVLGLSADLTGWIQSNGVFSLTASLGADIGPLHGAIDVTLSNSGFSAHLHAGIDWTASVGWWVFSATVGVRVSVDVGLAIQTDGTFSIDGNFQACAYLVIGGCFGLGFHLDNHELRIKTSDIGFSLWGVGFHPFNDIVIDY